MKLKFKKIKFYADNLFWLGLTICLSPIIFCTLIFRRTPKEPKKILVIQTAKIGDTVCTTPVFREIKKKYPASHLTLVCLPLVKGIVANNKYIDSIKTIDASRSEFIAKLKFIISIATEKYDWGFSMNPEGFNALLLFLGLIKNRVFIKAKEIPLTTKFLAIFQNHKIFYPKLENMSAFYLKALEFMGIKEVSNKREVYYTEEHLEKAEKFLAEYKISTNDLIIGVSITSGNTFKTWEFNYWVEFIDRLTHELNAKIILIGSAKEKDYNQQLISQVKDKSNIFNTAGIFKLEELPAMVSKFKLFISVDTGTSYIADASLVSTVTIVGPNDMNTQSPINKFIHVKNDLYCAPCAFIVPTARYCKEKHRRCFKETTPEMVWQGVLKAIKQYDIK